jgi:hypothetical protein
MKVCAIFLSLAGVAGGFETLHDRELAPEPTPQVAFSAKASSARPAASTGDSQRSIEEALIDAQGRDISLADLVRPEGDQ